MIEFGYSYLHSLFSVEIVSFQRKRLENLSHEPNKAMNINSYLGLLDKMFSIVNDIDDEQKQYSINDPDGSIAIPYTLNM